MKNTILYGKTNRRSKCSFWLEQGATFYDMNTSLNVVSISNYKIHAV